MRRAALVVSWMLVCAGSSGVAAHAQAVADNNGWVVLPVDEYRALRERANPPPALPAPPPVDATLTRVDYELRVDTDTVAGRAVLTIDVLRDGWTRVQIPAGLMARAAALDGQAVALEDGPTPRVLLSRAGRSTLTLDIVIPVSAASGAESIALPASPSAISRVLLTLPRSGVDVVAAGGFVSGHTDAANESRWTAYGRPGQPMTLTWKRKADDRRAELPLRVRARVTEIAGLGEDACQVAATVRVEVVQGLAREIALAIPIGLIVNQVDGPTVADWDTTGQQLRVRLLEPAAAEASFVVTGEARTPRDGNVTVPIVRVPSAERETGGVAVDVSGAGEISERQARGFEPADPSELGEIVAGRESPSMIAFRHRPLAGTDARSLTVAVVRYTPQAVVVANVEEARYRALVSEDGRLLVEARYAIRNNQRSFLKATLPQGAAVWSAAIDGRPVRPGVAEANAVLLPLEKGRAGEDAPAFVVEITYAQAVPAWTDGASARIELPSLDLPISRTGVELHYSPRFKVAVDAGAFRAADDPGPFAAAFREPAARSFAASPAPAPPSAPIGALVSKFKNEAGGRTVVGSLPIRVTFPSFGPYIFLASELTAESAAPVITLTVKKTR